MDQKKGKNDFNARFIQRAGETKKALEEKIAIKPDSKESTSPKDAENIAEPAVSSTSAKVTKAPTADPGPTVAPTASASTSATKPSPPTAAATPATKSSSAVPAPAATAAPATTAKPVAAAKAPPGTQPAPPAPAAAAAPAAPTAAPETKPDAVVSVGWNNVTHR